jgi:hypothetical protein
LRLAVDNGRTGLKITNPNHTLTKILPRVLDKM